ncbi:mannose-P-dolichol utilization defect 1 protein [Violaceomyces palustris]|uniref:Mannose-P-dolichol utilization defect 1 protein n=1 Tax=Violaceomyces palustris TaxID=1673888 RepID=A0ACD0NTR5_9BASI|nr:mannose-P-dolichol utilization defect 1 protein [Violaceomyces palustris]
MQSSIQQITRNLPEFVSSPAISLLGQECYTTVIYNVDLSSERCLRIVISKALGLGIVVFGSIMKVPQILNILRSRSARGISLSMYSLEVVAYTISLAYAVRSRLPFSTYGENLSLTFQNMIITLLVIAYSPARKGQAIDPASRKSAILVAALVMLSGSVALSSPTVIPPTLLTLLQALTIPISLASKVPQMLELHRDKARGQLSSIVVFAQLLGTIARVFTTMTETDDKLLLYGFSLATVFNAIIAVQVVMYWNGDKDGIATSKKGLEKEWNLAADRPISINTHGTSKRAGQGRKVD